MRAKPTHDLQFGQLQRLDKFNAELEERRTRSGVMLCVPT